jgi:hypothetical protein
MNALIDNTVNPVEPFLRTDRMPHIWCPGCGIGTTVNFLRQQPDLCNDRRADGSDNARSRDDIDEPVRNL